MNHWCVICLKASRRFSNHFHLECECGRIAHKMCAKTWSEMFGLSEWICPLKNAIDRSNFDKTKCGSCSTVINDHSASIDCSSCKRPVHCDVAHCDCCSLDQNKRIDHNKHGHSWICRDCSRAHTKKCEFKKLSPEEYSYTWACGKECALREPKIEPEDAPVTLKIALINANCSIKFNRDRLVELLDYGFTIDEENPEDSKSKADIIFGQEWWATWGQSWLEVEHGIPQNVTRVYKIVGSGSKPTWTNAKNHEAAIMWRCDKLYDRDSNPQLKAFDHRSLPDTDPFEIDLGVHRLVMVEFSTSKSKDALKLLTVSWHGFINERGIRTLRLKEEQKLQNADKLLKYTNVVAEKRNIKNILVCGDFNIDIHCLFYGSKYDENNLPISKTRKDGFVLAPTKNLYPENLEQSDILASQKDFVVYKGPNLEVKPVLAKKLDLDPRMDHLAYLTQIKFPVRVLVSDE